MTTPDTNTSHAKLFDGLENLRQALRELEDLLVHIGMDTRIDDAMAKAKLVLEQVTLGVAIQEQAQHITRACECLGRGDCEGVKREVEGI